MLQCKQGHEVAENWAVCPYCGQDLKKEPPQPKPATTADIQKLEVRIKRLEELVAKIETALQKKADVDHEHHLLQIKL